MRRLPLILATLALLVASAGAVNAGPRNVTNPMQATLDGGGWNVENVTNFVTRDGAVLGGTSLNVQSVTITDPGVSLRSIFGGSADPSVAPPLGNNPVSSLYLRQVDADHGELWFKVGPAATDWLKVAG